MMMPRLIHKCLKSPFHYLLGRSCVEGQWLDKKFVESQVRVPLHHHAQREEFTGDKSWHVRLPKLYYKVVNCFSPCWQNSLTFSLRLKFLIRARRHWTWRSAFTRTSTFRTWENVHSTIFKVSLLLADRPILAGPILSFKMYVHFETIWISLKSLLYFLGLKYIDKTKEGMPELEEESDCVRLTDFTDRVRQQRQRWRCYSWTFQDRKSVV